MTEDTDEPMFHADWEAHVFTFNGVMVGKGIYNLDKFRDSVERIPPVEFLAASYYERWLTAITTLLAEKGIASMEEPTGA